MAKKQKKTATKSKTTSSGYDDDDEEEWEEVDEPEAKSPGIPRVMVTWHGSGGETRPEPKQWHGISFEQGKPTPVEHLPPHVWDSMRRDIDAGGPEWSYEHVVEQPEPPPVEG